MILKFVCLGSILCIVSIKIRIDGNIELYLFVDWGIIMDKNLLWKKQNISKRRK